MGADRLTVGLNPANPGDYFKFDGWAKSWSREKGQKRNPPGELPRYDLSRKLETHPVGC